MVRYFGFWSSWLQSGGISLISMSARGGLPVGILAFQTHDVALIDLIEAVSFVVDCHANLTFRTSHSFPPLLMYL